MIWPALLLLQNTVHADTAEGIRRAVAAAKPGQTILIAPGDYPGGFSFAGVAGRPEAPVVIRGADPSAPPRFVGGGNAFHFSRARHLRLADMVFEKQTGNGLNIDDGGDFRKPSTDVVIEGIIVRDLPQGNHDGIKLSGVTHFAVKDCRIERWGGSGIDMVGCSIGLIEACSFNQGGSNGVQTKGGAEQILIYNCQFKNAGDRGVNLGGSTGLQFFRPPLDPASGEQRWEASRIAVSHCDFEGGISAAAFVGCYRGVVAKSRIRNPERWAFRILWENREPGFKGSEEGEFSENTVEFTSAKWFSGGVNIGDGGKPESFKFRANRWLCTDQPNRSRPTLPVPEIGGIYGQPIDPPETASKPPHDLKAIADWPDRASLIRLLESERLSKK